MSVAVIADADRIPFPASGRAIFDAAGVEVRLVAGHDLADVAPEASALLVRHGHWGLDAIGALPGLVVLTRCGSGIDNVDVDALVARGVTVTFVPDYGTDDVADQAIALALCALRRLGRADRLLRAGEWPGMEAFAGVHRLRGERVGVVGYGRIGRAVADRFQAFGAQVVVFDPSPPSGEGTTEHRVSLEELARTSLVMSLHCPLLTSTRKMVDAELLALMRNDAVLVNTSRGELVDEEALVAAMRAGTIAGAGLDVFDEEPLAPGSPLRSLDNVVLAPHSAAFTAEAVEEVARTAAADVVAVLEGRPPKWPAPSTPHW